MIKQTALPFINALKYKEKNAIIDAFGKHTFKDLIMQSKLLSKNMLHIVSDSQKSLNPYHLNGENVAILCDNDHSYVNAQWATWMLGATYVPLSKLHPLKELEHIVGDCKPKLLVGTTKYTETLTQICQKMDIDLLTFDPILKDSDQIYSRNKKLLSSALISDDELQSSWSEIDWLDTNSHIIYTSGTTGRPKGVVSSFSNLMSQVKDVNELWDVTCDDGYLHVLPLHHVHGIVINLISPLMAGATVTMLPEFNAKKV